MSNLKRRPQYKALHLMEKSCDHVESHVYNHNLNGVTVAISALSNKRQPTFAYAIEYRDNSNKMSQCVLKADSILFFLKLSSKQHKLCRYHYSKSPTTHIDKGYSERTTISILQMKTAYQSNTKQN